MFNSFKEHRQIRVIAKTSHQNGVKGISIPKRVAEEIGKRFDIENTWFLVQFKNDNIIFTSGCVPSGGTINGQR